MGGNRLFRTLGKRENSDDAKKSGVGSAVDRARSLVIGRGSRGKESQGEKDATRGPTYTNTKPLWSGTRTNARRLAREIQQHSEATKRARREISSGAIGWGSNKGNAKTQ